MRKVFGTVIVLALLPINLVWLAIQLVVAMALLTATRLVDIWTREIR